jgi:hypothetical protein
MAAIGNYGEALYQQVLPLHGPDPDGLARDYVGAVAQPFVEVDDLVRDTDDGPGWSVIFDVDATADTGLPWLAQVVGVALRQQRNGEMDATYATYARDAIRRQQGKDRGTVDAQISAVQDTLTGTRYANLLERVGGDAYAATMVVRASECPNSAATLAAWLNQKPAGIVPTLTLATGVIVDEGTRTIDASANTIDAAALADVT